MSEDIVEFGIELVDEVTPAAKTAAESLDSIDSKMRGLERSADLTGRKLGALMMSKGLEMVSHGAGRITATLESAFAGGVSHAKHLGKELVEGVVHMAAFEDQSKRAMSSLTGSDALGASAFKRTIELSNELGLSVEMAGHSMQKMLAMQFTPVEAEKFIKLTSDLRAVGVTADNVESILLDIAHIKATGFLNGRELQTFAMAGVSTALIMKEVGVGLGKNGKALSVEQAYEAMHKKKVTADVLFPALERAVMYKTHEHAAGEAGGKFAQSTLAGLWEQLQQAPDKLFLKINQTLPELVPKLSDAVRQINGFISTLDVGKLGKFVDSVMSLLLKGVPLAREFASGFMDGFAEITGGLGGLGLEAENLKAAHDLGKSFATTLGKIAEAMTTIANILKPLASETGMWLLGAVYAGTKAVGLFSKLAEVMTLIRGAGVGAAAAEAATGAAVAAEAASGVAVAAEATVATGVVGGTALTAAAVSLGTIAATAAAAAGTAYAGYLAYDYFANREKRASDRLLYEKTDREHARSRAENNRGNYVASLWGNQQTDFLMNQDTFTPLQAGMSSQFAMSTPQLAMVQDQLRRSEKLMSTRDDAPQYVQPPPTSKPTPVIPGGGILGSDKYDMRPNAFEQQIHISIQMSEQEAAGQVARDVAEAIERESRAAWERIRGNRGG